MATAHPAIPGRSGGRATQRESDGVAQRRESRADHTRVAAEPAGGVLVVAPEPFYEDRGTPIAVRQVVEALVRLGHDVDLLTFPVGRAPMLPGVRLFRSSNPLGIRRVPIGFSLRKLALDISLTAALRRLLRRNDYACIHAVEEAAFPAVPLAHGVGCPVIYDMHSSLPEHLAEYRLFRGPFSQWALRRCERWLLRNADLVVGSTGLASEVRAVAPETRIEEWSFVSEPDDVDPNEVDLLRRWLDLRPSAPVVLYTGSFEPYQGIPLLLSAVPRIREVVEDVVVVLVGGDAGACRSADVDVAALEAADAVRLVPRQPRERMPAFRSMADVLVSPRRNGANLPLKIFDYLASGRPIVATDNPTHRTILDDRLAVLVPPSPEGLAREICGLLGDRERAGRLGEAGLRYAREHLSRERFVESVGAIYGRVIE